MALKDDKFAPIVFMWVKTEWLANRLAHEFPAAWELHVVDVPREHKKAWVQIAVKHSYFIAMLEYEKKMECIDLPF